MTGTITRRAKYEAVGFTVVTHWIERDEFWWKGVNIGEKGANSVVYYTAVKGTAPRFAGRIDALLGREPP